ncbi:HTH-type transcriptional regulator DegA [subsurface metagenome]
MRKTLKDVARKAGVSVSVASRALGSYGYVSRESQKKVLGAAEKIGYQSDYIAKGLKTQQTYTIGLIISDITNSWFTPVVRAIEDVAEQNGYNLILCNSDENPRKEIKYLEVLYGKRIDGLIIAVTGRNPPYLKRLVRSGLPVVLLDRKIKGLPATEVSIDNEYGAYEAVNHLIKLGHQRIGIINGLSRTTVGEDRFRGYKKALEDNDLPLDPSLIKYGDFRMEKAKKATQEFIKMKNRPTALFVANNVMVMGAFKTLRKNKVKIPQEMALVGFDDPEWASLTEPPLTAVRQPTYSIGTMACQALLQRIRKSDRRRFSEEEIVLKPKLIVRKSCGAGF